jgi:chromate transporter
MNTQPPFKTALAFWIKLGWISFGGPSGQIALMHRELVDRKKWIGESTFLHGLNFAMLLPGPKAHQLATYLGWKLHGWRGALAAGGGFILPAAGLLWGLSWLYVTAGKVPWVQGALEGLKACVLAIVLHAVFKLGTRTMKTPFSWVLAGCAWAGLAWAGFPYPALILAAAVVGVILHLTWWFGWTVLFPEGQPDPAAFVIMGVCLVGLVRWNWNLLAVIAGSGAAGVLVHFLFPV